MPRDLKENEGPGVCNHAPREYDGLEDATTTLTVGELLVCIAQEFSVKIMHPSNFTVAYP